MGQQHRWRHDVRRGDHRLGRLHRRPRPLAEQRLRGRQARPGCGPPPGHAALDPINGLPLSWNPTRTRGVGVFDFLVNAQGLWVASDTTRIGADYLRSRIALLPTGGTSFPGVKTPSLPNDVYSVKQLTGGIQERSYTGSVLAAAQNAPTGTLTTNNVRGAFMLNGYLYVAWSNGTFDRRTFDGTNYGVAESVDTSSKLTALTDWSADISTMTGLFYDSGRLYFTKSGFSTLYYRYLTPESKVVGAQRLTASANVVGIDVSQVRGIFVADGNLYWSSPSNDLRKLGWTQGAQSGAPAAGVATIVSSPTVDGYIWVSPRALFLFQDADGDGPSAAPVAGFTSTCTSLSCAFDSSTSTAASGAITGRSWSFGDATTSTEANPTHAFAATGSYQVALTVASSKDLTHTTTQTVQVTRVNQVPGAGFSYSCNTLVCSFDATDSSDPGGTWRATSGASVTAPLPPAARSTTPTAQREPATSR